MGNLLSFASTPSDNGGRLQVGLQGFEYYNTSIFPFANLWKCSNWPVVVRSAVTYDGSQGPGKSNSPWGLWLDSNGDLASPMDAGITEYRRFWWENNNAGANSLIGRDMVLVFTGTASTVSFDGSPSNIVRVGNRVTFTVTTDGTNRVKFSGFTNVNDPPKVTYLCFAEDEAAVIANPLALRPNALSNLREAGIIRWMDPLSINSNRATLSVSDLATADYCKWGGVGRESGLKHGMPLSVMGAVCNQLASHLYFNMPSRIGMAKTGAITSWTRGTTTVVGSYPLPANGDEVIFYKLSGLSRTFTCTADAGTDTFTAGAAHNLVEDQVILFTGGTLAGGTNINGARTAYYIKNVTATTFQISTVRGGSVLNLTSNGGTITVTVTPEGDKFTVANVNAGAGTFELTGPGSDTTLLSAISTSDVRNNQWSTQANFTTMRTAMVNMLTELDSHLNPGLKIFLGYGNEIFNTGLNFDYFYWARAQSRWSWIGIDSQSTMHGYLTGILASAANEAFTNRERWKGVIELHTSGSLANLPFTGLAQAVTDFNPSLTVGDLIDHGAVTTYYSESFGAGANQATLTTWISDSQAAHVSDPITNPTEYSHFVRRVGTASYDGTGGPPTDSIYITEMPALWDTENGRCVTAGITGGLICYEGGCHITGSSLNSTTQDWLEEYFGSEPHADNVQQVLDLWDAETYTSYPSQFLAHCIKDGATGCWGVRDQVGVDTPVSDVYSAYNSA